MKIIVTVLLVYSLIATACAPSTTQTAPSVLPGANDMADPAQRWEALQLEAPFAYTTPLPAPEQSPIDGLYAKVDETPPQYWKCLRCADYRPAGGIWRLLFEKGVLRIYYEVTGWYSIASYTVTDDELHIFNDPFCPFEIGRYKWQLEDERLVLEPIQDTACAFELREQNLANQPWIACAGSHGEQPSGCEIPEIPTSDLLANLPVAVRVSGGDSRFFEIPPEVYTAANTADREPPEGIHINYHEQAVGYGLHRILWWNGDWIEATTELPFTSMGVQVMGEAQIGWAHVLFDGQEVWRGDTAAIWEKYGRHGGYIEVSGYEPGTHTLRIESMNFDFRPVTIAGFGFSYEPVSPY